MSLLPNPREWAVHNARWTGALRRYFGIRHGMPFHTATVCGPKHKNGRTRWECKVYAGPALHYEFCFFLFATKAEAIAKAVELVVAGYVVRYKED